jgi:hypothetical protein
VFKEELLAAAARRSDDPRDELRALGLGDLLNDAPAAHDP